MLPILCQLSGPTAPAGRKNALDGASVGNAMPIMPKKENGHPACGDHPSWSHGPQDSIIQSREDSITVYLMGPFL
jgi:hypothetical protein